MRPAVSTSNGVPTSAADHGQIAADESSRSRHPPQIGCRSTIIHVAEVVGISAVCSRRILAGCSSAASTARHKRGLIRRGHVVRLAESVLQIRPVKRDEPSSLLNCDVEQRDIAEADEHLRIAANHVEIDVDPDIRTTP